MILTPTQGCFGEAKRFLTRLFLPNAIMVFIGFRLFTVFFTFYAGVAFGWFSLPFVKRDMEMEKMFLFTRYSLRISNAAPRDCVLDDFRSFLGGNVTEV